MKRMSIDTLVCRRIAQAAQRLKQVIRQDMLDRIRRIHTRLVEAKINIANTARTAVKDRTLSECPSYR